MPVTTSSLPPLTTIPDGRHSSYAVAAMGVASMPASATYSPSVSSLPPHLHATRANRSSSSLLGDYRPRRSTSEDLGFAYDPNENFNRRPGWTRSTKSEKDVQRSNNYAFTAQQMERLNAAAKSRELRQQQLIGSSKRRLGALASFRAPTDASAHSGPSAAARLPSSMSVSSANSCPVGIGSGNQYLRGNHDSTPYEVSGDDDSGVSPPSLARKHSISSGTTAASTITASLQTAPSSLNMHRRGGSGIIIGTRADETSIGDLPDLYRNVSDGVVGMARRFNRDFPHNRASASRNDDDDEDEEDFKVGIALPTTRKRGRGRAKYDDYDTDEELMDSMYDEDDGPDDEDEDQSERHCVSLPPPSGVSQLGRIDDALPPMVSSSSKREALVSTPSSATLLRKNNKMIPSSIITTQTSTRTLRSGEEEQRKSAPVELVSFPSPSNPNGKLPKPASVRCAPRNKSSIEGLPEKKRGRRTAKSEGTEPDAFFQVSRPASESRLTGESVEERVRVEGENRPSLISAFHERESYGRRRFDESEQPETDDQSDVAGAGDRDDNQDDSSAKSTQNDVPEPEEYMMKLDGVGDGKDLEKKAMMLYGSFSGRNVGKANGQVGLNDEDQTQADSLREATSLPGLHAGNRAVSQSSGRIRRTILSFRRASRGDGRCARNAHSAPYVRAVTTGAMPMSRRASGFHPFVPRSLRRFLRQQRTRRTAARPQRSREEGESTADSHDPRDVESNVSVSTLHHPIEATAILDEPSINYVYAKAESLHSMGKLNLVDRPLVFCFAVLAIAGIGAIIAVTITLSFAGGNETPPTNRSSDGHEKTKVTLMPTAAPTVSLAPTVDIDVVKNALKDFSMREDLDTIGTPQNCALRWLIRHDLSGLDTDSPKFIQRYALTVLYYATNGFGCIDHEDDHRRSGSLFALNPRTHECLWGSGVTCRQLGERSVVTALDLSRSELKGTIPPEISLLHDIESLCLNENHLRGSIPSEIGALKFLGRLEVRDNMLNGTVPSTISNLRNLDDLVLSSNDVTGTIPDELFSLTELRLLDISHNKFSGSLSDELRNLRRLNSLNVISNQLTGTLPSALGQLKNLAFVHCDNNEFNGTLQDAMAVISLRQEFTVSNNQLTGTLPEIPQSDDIFFISVMESMPLRKVDLSGNRLHGELEPTLALLIPLQYADFSRNLFNGKTEAFEIYAPNLEFFNVSSNRLSGSLPHVSSAPNLKYIDFQKNQLTGTVPDSWKKLEKLEHLDLSDNHLKGVDPWIANYTKLEYLNLRNCNISGTLSDDLGSLSRLHFIDFGLNTVSGTIPGSIGRFSSLVELHLDGNNLVGRIPSTFGDLEELRTLSLKSNRLRGTIPSELSSLTNLEELLLTNNNIIGTVPKGVCDLLCSGNLDVLEVDDNVGAVCGCSSRVSSQIHKKTDVNGSSLHLNGQ